MSNLLGTAIFFLKLLPVACQHLVLFSQIRPFEALPEVGIDRGF
ncbi:MAG TPA: hypothetical protein VK017_06660 [Sphingobacterium sp.]|nr:hypothetical protein [Sphingobacterium sp.]